MNSTNSAPNVSNPGGDFDDIGGGGTNAIPEHLNASDFTLFNSTPETVAALQLWLDTLQNSDDTAGKAITREMWLEGGRVVLNPYEAPSPEALANMTPEMKDYLTRHIGVDVWDTATHAMYWNPFSALQVVDANGKMVGVQSAGTGWVHEATHGIDGNSIAHMGPDEKDPTWHNTAEYIATQYENMSAASRGEVGRDSYGPGNVDLRVDNPTVHTGTGTDGLTKWLKTNASGQVETGPAYDHETIAKVWGTDKSIPPDPGHAPTFGTADLAGSLFPQDGGIDLSSFDWGALFGDGDQGVIDMLGGPALLQGIAGMELIIQIIGTINIQDWGWNYVE